MTKILKKMLAVFWRIAPLGGLLLLASCAFEPEGDYFDQSDSTAVPSMVTISLVGIAQDTINVADDLSLQFQLSFPGRKLYAYRVSTKEWIVDERFYGFNERPTDQLFGTFVISPEELLQAGDELKIEIAYSAGTGTLADRAGSEVEGKERKWTLLEQ